MSDLRKAVHDLNNLLSIVMTYTAFAIEDIQDESVLADLAEVRTAAEKATQLTAELMSMPVA